MTGSLDLHDRRPGDQPGRVPLPGGRDQLVAGRHHAEHGQVEAAHPGPGVEAGQGEAGLVVQFGVRAT